jgi:cell division septum initiation protein DivIVA
MAKKTTEKRYRRNDEELIRDLEAKLQSVKERVAARSIKRSPSMKHTVAAVRAIDKALESASSENNTTLRHALADAREPLVAYLQLEGVKLPKTRRPKGPRPKA